VPETAASQTAGPPQPKEIDGADFLLGGVVRKVEDDFYNEDEDVDLDVKVIEVLRQNMLAVTVFRLCELEIVSGMSISYRGIPAREIESAIFLTVVPQDERLETAQKVKRMGDVVADAANKEAQRKLNRNSFRQRGR